MKNIFTQALFTILTLASALWFVPDAFADSGAMAYKGAVMLNEAQTGQTQQGSGANNLDDDVSVALMALMMLLFAIFILVKDIIGKEVKRRGLKICLDILAVVLALPAWFIVLIYVIVRIIIALFSRKK